MFGLKSSLPIFIAPAALARLGHPDGEMNLVRAAGLEGILQGASEHPRCLEDKPSILTRQPDLEQRQLLRRRNYVRKTARSRPNLPGELSR